jgi:hypothetical protein
MTRGVLDSSKNTLAVQPCSGESWASGFFLDRRVVSFQPSAELKPAMPMIAWRDLERWTASGGTGGGGYKGLVIGEYPKRSAIQAWRFYVFAAPETC